MSKTVKDSQRQTTTDNDRQRSPTLPVSLAQFLPGDIDHGDLEQGELEQGEYRVVQCNKNGVGERQKNSSFPFFSIKIVFFFRYFFFENLLKFSLSFFFF